jgi:hypothetical protein
MLGYPVHGVAPVHGPSCNPSFKRIPYKEGSGVLASVENNYPLHTCFVVCPYSSRSISQLAA